MFLKCFIMVGAVITVAAWHPSDDPYRPMGWGNGNEGWCWGPQPYNSDYVYHCCTGLQGDRCGDPSNCCVYGCYDRGCGVDKWETWPPANLTYNDVRSKYRTFEAFYDAKGRKLERYMGHGAQVHAILYRMWKNLMRRMP